MEGISNWKEEGERKRFIDFLVAGQRVEQEESSLLLLVVCCEVFLVFQILFLVAVGEDLKGCLWLMIACECKGLDSDPGGLFQFCGS